MAEELSIEAQLEAQQAIATPISTIEVAVPKDQRTPKQLSQPNLGCDRSTESPKT